MRGAVPGVGSHVTACVVSAHVVPGRVAVVHRRPRMEVAVHGVQSVVRDGIVGEELRDPAGARLLAVDAHGAAEAVAAAVVHHLRVAADIRHFGVRPDRVHVVVNLSGVTIRDGLGRILPQAVGVEAQLVAERTRLERCVEASPKRVRGGRKIDVNRERRRALRVPHRGRLVVVVHHVALGVQVDLSGNFADRPLGRT